MIILFYYTKLYYFFDTSTESFLNSFNAFSIAKDAFLARVPAALFAFSACCAESLVKSEISTFKFSSNSFIIICFLISHKDIVIFQSLYTQNTLSPHTDYHLI